MATTCAVYTVVVMEPTFWNWLGEAETFPRHIVSEHMDMGDMTSAEAAAMEGIIGQRTLSSAMDYTVEEYTFIKCKWGGVENGVPDALKERGRSRTCGPASQ